MRDLNSIRFATAHAHAWAVFVSALTLSAPSLGAIAWTVAVNDPASGTVQVTLEIPLDSIGERAHLDLTFPDAHDFSGRVSAFHAQAGSKSIEVQERHTERSQRFRMPLADKSKRPIAIGYTVDARFYPPGSEDGARRDARAIMESDLGVLRTRTIFAAGLHTSQTARVRFELPKDWIAVTPWDRDEDGFILPPNALRDTEYLGIGPFDVSEIRIAETQCRIGSMGAGNELVERLPALIEFEQRIAGTAPRSAHQRHSVILVPRGFIQGGSAGRRSVVQSPNPVTLAHEVFHWWNHAGIAAPEARWFSEGFTEYFAIEAARASGLVSDAYAESCYADLDGEMRHLERDGAVSLADASRRYGEREAQRLVYGKGALFAYWMDRELHTDGRDLSAVLPVVFADPNRRHDNAALAHAFDLAFDGAMNDAFHTYVGTATPLPDLGLPEATGESGRTRFLPVK